MRKFAIAFMMTLLTMSVSAGAVWAAHTDPGDRTAPISSMSCVDCHENSAKHTSGPHGGYTSSTDKCGTCHDVHANAGNAQLLAGQTLTASCNYCHDLTGTHAGPYHMAEGTTAAAAHRVVGVNTGSYTDTEGHANESLIAGVTTIPGGNGTDGSAGTLDGSVQGPLSGTVFTCDSCHTPHGVNTVNPYLGESDVKTTSNKMLAGQAKIYLTNRILKSKPNNAAEAVTEYGSKWCLACHQGRNALTAETTHNHPVSETTPAYSFLSTLDNYLLNGKSLEDITADNVLFIDTNAAPAAEAELSKDPRSNAQYAMTSLDELNKTVENPNGTPRPDGNVSYDAAKAAGGPACQQCHGSARDVESAFLGATNPAAGNFPHISANKGLLVEIQDDFCTNCHALSMLP